MTFLKAKWQNLIMVNYEIDPKILTPFIPNGTEIDLFNGACFLSLVGFMFKDTKVLGLKFPYHVDFEEVNLRFYVKHEEKRGVVFIKEIVPKPLITLIANLFYKEHYQTAKMSHVNNISKHKYSYSWNMGGINNTISVATNHNAKELQAGTEAAFIAEHYYGYTKYKNKTFEYEVTHPKWEQLEVTWYDINVDFEKNYGNTFKFLNAQKPSSVFLALGSKITVKNKQLINPLYTT